MSFFTRAFAKVQYVHVIDKAKFIILTKVFTNCQIMDSRIKICVKQLLDSLTQKLLLFHSIITHIYENHINLGFLYIFCGSGLLWGGRTLNYHKRVKCCWIAFLASSGIFLQGGAPHPGSPHEMDPAKKNTFNTPLDKQWVKINS